MSRCLLSFLLVTFGLLAGGCATAGSSMAGDDTGPVAQVRDSAVVHSDYHVDFYFVRRVNGRRIEDSRSESFSASRGRGLRLVPAIIGRPVPAPTVELELVGRSEDRRPVDPAAAPVVYQVAGRVRLTLQAGHDYVVRGELTETREAVWVEDGATGEVVGEPVVRVRARAAGPAPR